MERVFGDVERGEVGVSLLRSRSLELSLGEEVGFARCFDATETAALLLGGETRSVGTDPGVLYGLGGWLWGFGQDCGCSLLGR